MTQPSSSEGVQPDAVQRMAMIREHYATPEATLEGMRHELDAFETAMGEARAHWDEVMPGRSWSPAQEIEHTIQINESSGKLVRLMLSDKPLRPSAAQPGERTGDGRWKSPPSMEPSGPGELQPYEALLERHRASRALLEVGAQPDPQRTFFHPFMGPLDALDWLRMAAFQTGHHRRTLRKGLKALEQG